MLCLFKGFPPSFMMKRNPLPPAPINKERIPAKYQKYHKDPKDGIVMAQGDFQDKAKWPIECQVRHETIII